MRFSESQNFKPFNNILLKAFGIELNKTRDVQFPETNRTNRMIYQIVMVEYTREKDILYLGIDPGVESVSRTKDGSVWTIWDRQEKSRLVGIEVIDFKEVVLPQVRTLKFKGLPDRFILPSGQQDQLLSNTLLCLEEI